jgi:hypothetical protein
LPCSAWGKQGRCSPQVSLSSSVSLGEPNILSLSPFRNSFGIQLLTVDSLHNAVTKAHQSNTILCVLLCISLFISCGYIVIAIWNCME